MMNRNMVLSKSKIARLLFFASYGIYLIFSILSTSFYAHYISGMTTFTTLLCIFILLIVEGLQSKYTKKTFLVFAFSISMCLLMYFCGGLSFMCIMAFVYCGRNIKFEHIAKYSITITVFIVSFIILSSKVGIITNYTTMRNGIVRQFLGFLYTLFAPCYLFNVTSLYLYIKKRRVKWLQILFLIAVNYLMFITTDARLSFYVSLMVIILMAILKIKPNILQKMRLVCFLMSLSWVLISTLSIYLIVVYNPGIKWMNDINTFLGGRINLGQKGILTYGISLFGNKIKWIGNGLSITGEVSKEAYNYVDNVYAKVLIQNGIVFYVFFIFLFTYLAWKCWKEKDYYALIILTVLAMRGAVDDLSFNLYYNTFWFVIGTKLMNTFRRNTVIYNWNSSLRSYSTKERTI